MAGFLTSRGYFVWLCGSVVVWTNIDPLTIENRLSLVSISLLTITICIEKLRRLLDNHWRKYFRQRS